MTFFFFIGGYASTHFEVKLTDKQLCYYLHDWPMRVGEPYIAPTHTEDVRENPAWSVLLEWLGNADWLPEYNSPIMDGIQWKINFKDGKAAIKSNGSNAYPDDFQTFLKLLSNVSSHPVVNKHLSIHLD